VAGQCHVFLLKLGWDLVAGGTAKPERAQLIRRHVVLANEVQQRVRQHRHQRGPGLPEQRPKLVMIESSRHGDGCARRKRREREGETADMRAG
jgi:hypothetical protein